MSDSSEQQDFSQRELQELTAINPADIRLAAMNLLARREHSRRELRRKLQKRFDDQSLIDQQLDRLAHEKLQCDERFAESFVRQRISGGYGPLRIKADLHQRGLTDEEVERALHQEACDWPALARDVIERKFGLTPAEDIQAKARRNRFMQYRGFTSDHYRHLL